jgi:hypothetical protein
MHVRLSSAVLADMCGTWIDDVLDDPLRQKP